MIYLLEDDDNIRNFVLYALNNSDLTAVGFGLPGEFWTAMKKDGGSLPDLILLDIMLPEESGLEVLSKLRSDVNTMNIPIAMLTAKSSEYDKVIGLDSGADDYITKPFGTMELMARVRALLRRTGYRAKEKEYVIGHLQILAEEHVVKVDGKEVLLTFKEHELLSFLAENTGHALTRDQILQTVWGYEFDGENRTVDVHIRMLRSKLGVGGEQIETVRGIGYRLIPGSSAAQSEQAERNNSI